MVKCLLRHKLITKIPKDGDLTSWASQGVLLLNTALTTIAGKANAHEKIWPEYTKELIKSLAERPKPIVFILLGTKAKAFESVIKTAGGHHPILMGPHPSPMNARSDFSLCEVFKDTNTELVKCGFSAINWDSINGTVRQEVLAQQPLKPAQTSSLAETQYVDSSRNHQVPTQQPSYIAQSPQIHEQQPSALVSNSQVSQQNPQMVGQQSLTLAQSQQNDSLSKLEKPVRKPRASTQRSAVDNELHAAIATIKMYAADKSTKNFNDMQTVLIKLRGMTDPNDCVELQSFVPTGDNTDSDSLYLFTDGGASGNGKAHCRASWAFLITTLQEGTCVGDSDLIAGQGTNNIGELTAILRGLECIRDHNGTFNKIPKDQMQGCEPIKYKNVTIISDSEYALNCVFVWYKKWIAEGRDADKKNIELIKRIVDLVDQLKEPPYSIALKHQHQRSHQSQPDSSVSQISRFMWYGNDQVDKMCTAALANGMK
jgi:ribonuclease HI